ncbi:uncharacterized protein LOC132871654 [Neoarius graeffei]|uniref:uncharacterized protein LOC132871654 n=1 Tax=Neoarius graeffei TaxID=443677 RepID=UPI00298D1F58|nr:uncharacterized protein LOC132871654 [Neoarius graeffei]
MTHSEQGSLIGYCDKAPKLMQTLLWETVVEFSSVSGSLLVNKSVKMDEPAQKKRLCSYNKEWEAKSDASNKGNRKMFPVCVRYFSALDGVQSKLLDFYEDSDETANGIHQALIACLDTYGLNVKNITAYAADNANVNFGKHHSVYKLLGSANDGILKANCPAHVAHNACKYASDKELMQHRTYKEQTPCHCELSLVLQGILPGSAEGQEDAGIGQEQQEISLEGVGLTG